jgi:hypothetical protein
MRRWQLRLLSGMHVRQHAQKGVDPCCQHDVHGAGDADADRDVAGVLG